MMIRKTLLVSILSLFTLCGIAQNLDEMPIQKRDSILIDLAEKNIKQYAPGYYRKYGIPKIRKAVIQQNMVNLNYGARYGRIAYIVTFPYDTNKEYFSAGYSAEVTIWGDTGKPYFLASGNGIGMAFKEDQTRSVEENVEVIPYVKHKRPEPYDFMKKRN